MNTDYIKNHDYGYGINDDENEPFKLQLRNLGDLKTYVDDVNLSTLLGKIRGNVVKFKSGKKEQFFVEMI